LGFKPSKEELGEILNRVKKIGDQGIGVTDADLMSIAQEAMSLKVEDPIKMDEFIVVTGNKIMPTSSVKLHLNGDSFIEAATGNGPVDATLNAIKKAINPDFQAYLDSYQVDAITGGSDAMVNVEIRLRKGDRIVSAKGVNEDIVMASVEAYLRGMNVLLISENAPKKYGSKKV